MAVHVVKSGESLWAISRMYGISIREIVSVNGLPSANSLVPGLALFIPQPQQMYQRVHRVRPGDTYWKLAVEYNTSISGIATANPGLKPGELRVGQIIEIPSPLKLEMETLGFIVPYSAQSFLSQLPSLAPDLTYLAVAAYSFTEEGYVYVQLEDREIVVRSLQLNVKPLLMIRNLTANEFSAGLAGRVLSNPALRRNLVSSLSNLTRERGYSGVSIDFEFIPPAQRNDFLFFLTELKQALGSLILHVNVHAKTEDIPANPIIGAYDYRGIASIADIVAVMTIDYGYPGGPPDPISPLWWVEQVIAYAVGQIPPKKLQIAMPLYGYDKVIPGNLTLARSLLASQNLAISNWRPIQFDLRSQSPHFRYRQNNQEHVVWFEDIRTTIAKFRLIDIYGLAGTTFWQLSLPAPQNWAYIRNAIQVVK
ncbi:chitinase [Mesobacillus campisalis]|uniref:Chitinase n=1 Tax=Mesobacillus campisalis TaxID=1408103 RepID=A0A0M2SY07_9BACI|nr:LysM peptidoglycan-binding domain-containing protein [Mesobacillus campisalis]KKK37852.1 chitinase [Mesobacillus campisalis]